MTDEKTNEEAELIHKAFDAAKTKMEADIPNPTAGRKDTDAGKPGKDKNVLKPNTEEDKAKAAKAHEEEQGDGAEQDEMGAYAVKVRGKPVPLKDITVTSPGGEEMGLDDYMKAMTVPGEDDGDGEQDSGDGENKPPAKEQKRWTFKETVQPRTVSSRGANVSTPTPPSSDTGLFTEVVADPMGGCKVTVNTDYFRSITEQLNKPGMNGAALHTREAARMYRGLAADVLTNAMGGA